MSKIDMERFFNKKQENIKAIAETKNLGMEFANALNAAVEVWKTIKELPGADINDELQIIMDLVTFFRTMKGEIKAEVTAEQVVKEAEKVFPDSRVAPQPRQDQSPPRESPLCSEPQEKMIHAKLNNMGYKSDQHTVMVQKILGLARLDHVPQLTKAQASEAIKILIGMEGSRK